PYIQAMFAAYDLPKTSDLCCYWFELARRVIGRHGSTRAGLLATQGIRGGDNRTVLERISHEGGIFMAWSDRDWILDGATVHVSIVGFDGGASNDRVLDGEGVAQINPDLTSGAAAASAKKLGENVGLGYMGDTKGGAFDLGWEEARRMLATPNPRTVANSD